MTPREPCTEDDIERGVLGYLENHPRAMDTAEGIAEWWLMRQRIRVDVSKVLAVVNRLTERGLLERLEGGQFRRTNQPRTDVE